jgi:hypothetical protein
MSFRRIATLLECLGGSGEVPLEWRERTWFPVARGIFWLLLLAVVFAFAGRTTRFIYVDF